MKLTYIYLLMVLSLSFLLAYLLIKQIDKTNFLYSITVLYGLIGTTIIILIHIIRFY